MRSSVRRRRVDDRESRRDAGSVGGRARVHDRFHGRWCAALRAAPAPPDSLRATVGTAADRVRRGPNPTPTRTRARRSIRCRLEGRAPRMAAHRRWSRNRPCTRRAPSPHVHPDAGHAGRDPNLGFPTGVDPSDHLTLQRPLSPAAASGSGVLLRRSSQRELDGPQRGHRRPICFPSPCRTSASDRLATEPRGAGV